MELDNTNKKAILDSLIAQLRQSEYMNTVMGQTWQTIGNVEMAKQCAEKLAENIKAIAELQKKLDSLA